MTKAEARRRMLEADRERARIAYAGIDRLVDEYKIDRRIRRNCATAKYIAADERFRKYSAIVGNEGPADLARMLSF